MAPQTLQLAQVAIRRPHLLEGTAASQPTRLPPTRRQCQQAATSSTVRDRWMARGPRDARNLADARVLILGFIFCGAHCPQLRWARPSYANLGPVPSYGPLLGLGDELGRPHPARLWSET